MSTRRKVQRKAKKEKPVSEQSQMMPPQQDRPSEEDIIQTLMEEVQSLNDQRLFFKSQVLSYRKRAEHAEMAQASLQARVDQLEAEANGEVVGEEQAEQPVE